MRSVFFFRCLRSLTWSQFDFQNLDSGQHPSASLTKTGKREEKNSARKKKNERTGQKTFSSSFEFSFQKYIWFYITSQGVVLEAAAFKWLRDGGEPMRALERSKRSIFNVRPETKSIILRSTDTNELSSGKTWVKQI